MLLYVCVMYMIMSVNVSVSGSGQIRRGVSEWLVWMATGACTPMYLPPLVLFNPLMGHEWMNKKRVLSLKFSLLTYHYPAMIINPNPKPITLFWHARWDDHPWRRSQRRMHDDNVNAKCARMTMIMWEKFNPWCAVNDGYNMLDNVEEWDAAIRMCEKERCGKWRQTKMVME